MTARVRLPGIITKNRLMAVLQRWREGRVRVAVGGHCLVTVCILLLSAWKVTERDRDAGSSSLRAATYLSPGRTLGLSTVIGPRGVCGTWGVDRRGDLPETTDQYVT